MNAKEFFDKVVEMRKAQKDFFKSRDSQVLMKAKALERVIDQEIKRIEDMKQTKLF